MNLVRACESVLSKSTSLRRKREVASDLARELTKLQTGLRGSILIDCFLPTSEQIKDLAQHLNDLSGTPAFRGFSVEGQDFFLANQGWLRSHLREALKTTKFIDISSDLQLPKLIKKNDPQFKNIQGMIESVKDEDNIVPEPGWNVPTLFGVLLGYPVVYWFSDVDSCRTCLDGTELVVNEIVSEDNNILMQFSYPQCLRSELEPHITEFKSKSFPNQNLKTRVVRQDSIVL